MCNCWTKHHILYFVAGAAFWDVISHISLHFSGVLPLTFWGMTITQSNNPLFIAIALAICLIALFGARSLGGCKCCSSNGSSKNCC